MLYTEGHFKQKFSPEQQKKESDKLLIKYPDRIPIIVEQQKSIDAIKLDKHKFLVPLDITVGQFCYIIRKRVHLPPEKAMYLFFNQSLVNTAEKIGNVYETHKDVSGFLFCTVCSENTYG